MIVIVIDSTACMTREEARKLGVVCVPMTYTLDGTAYTERFVDANGNYDRLIENARDQKTSQASIDAYYKLFRGLLDANYEVLCLTISSRLSGTYSNASVCARELGEDRIKVVDTATTAGGMLIMTKEARRLVDSGLTLFQAAQALTNMRTQVKTLFSVKDMGPLRRSGRLGPVRQSVGTILNLRPLLTCKDGAVEACGTARGRTEQLQRLIDAVPEDAEDIIVHYIQSEQDAKMILDRLMDKCKNPVLLRKVGPVLGIHLGLDVLSTMWRDIRG
ncbi:DegV family protein [Christensenellaceae bacterium OttesenSCG-928-M15]|nr:DegV family protein [Christensenellaceae bacterium OttesenSCG-928-M15]